MQLRAHPWLYRIGCSFLFALFFSPLFAQTLKGKVYDSKTGEPLIGASVVVENTQYKTIVNLDGSFIIRFIPAGKYRIFVSTVGYQPSKGVEVEITGAQEVKVIDIPLA